MPPQRRDLHHAFVLALALRHPRHCNMAIHTRRQHKIHAIDIPAIKTPPIRQPHLRRRAIPMLAHHIPAQRTNRHTLHAHTLPLAQKIAPPHPQIDIFRSRPRLSVVIPSAAEESASAFSSQLIALSSLRPFLPLLFGLSFPQGICVSSAPPQPHHPERSGSRVLSLSKNASYAVEGPLHWPLLLFVLRPPHPNPPSCRAPEARSIPAWGAAP